MYYYKSASALTRAQGCASDLLPTWVVSHVNPHANRGLKRYPSPDTQRYVWSRNKPQRRGGKGQFHGQLVACVHVVFRPVYTRLVPAVGSLPYKTYENMYRDPRLSGFSPTEYRYQPEWSLAIRGRQGVDRTKTIGSYIFRLNIFPAPS